MVCEYLKLIGRDVLRNCRHHESLASGQEKGDDHRHARACTKQQRLKRGAMKTAVIRRRTLLIDGVLLPVLGKKAVTVGVKRAPLLLNPRDMSIGYYAFNAVDAIPNLPPYSLPLSLGNIANFLQLTFHLTSAQRVVHAQNRFVTSLREETNGAVTSHTDFKDRNIPILATLDTLPNLYPFLFMNCRADQHGSATNSHNAGGEPK